MFISEQHISEHLKYYANTTISEYRKTATEYFFKCIIYLLFRERGREGESEGEKHQCVVAPHTPPIGDLACMQPRHVP